jgi:sulfatase maturation enzyme AslB (radical SAM superfamily)
VRPLDFPNNVQIQTTAFCNASCIFCPYPETSKTLPMGTMDEDLFRAIVDQLAGREILLLQPFLMIEPLMD